MDARVLITGGTGFIGTAVCERLVAAGAEVHATSRRADVDLPAGVRGRQLDPADAQATRATLEAVEPDVVFHLASAVTGARGRENVLPTLHGNLVAAVNVLAAVAETGCRRVLLAGSLEEPAPDAPAPVPQSPYAAAKWGASAYARMFHALYGTPAVVLRLFMVYGPGQRDTAKLVPYATRALLAGEAPQITSGTREVDWIYIDDVVEAFVAATSAPGIDGATIDVGTGELHSVRHVVETLVRLTGGPPPVFGAIPDRPLEVVRAADAARTGELLGWRAGVPLEEGLARTVEAIREAPGV